jgi:hypothetical protein
MVNRNIILTAIPQTQTSDPDLQQIGIRISTVLSLKIVFSSDVSCQII